MTKIPGRTEEEKRFDQRILCELSLIWMIYQPVDINTRQGNRWLEQCYYRRKWRLLCDYSQKNRLPEFFR